ncbi:MAG: DUF3604 domain-containing protein [Myxococcota bacterium]
MIRSLPPLAGRRLAVLAPAVLVLIATMTACGDRDEPGSIEGGRRPRALDASRAAAQRAAAPVRSKRILFGDLHVHTTYSIDALVFSLSLFGGEGAHPLADACDFARHCSALDFFSINDHAESLTPERWEQTKQSIRECNALAGDPEDPDLVAFVGWEWTQAAGTPEAHYGHKNVIFPGLSDEELPARPITSLPPGTMGRARAAWLLRGLRVIEAFGWESAADLLWLVQRMTEVPDCPPGVDSRWLPPDCRENASTPAELFEKLAQWGFETLVIPHGLAWGKHAPPGARLDNQLSRAQHVPQLQRLVEVFSGHGNSEEFRTWGELEATANGEPVCREPTPDFLPCCWRAGEIMRSRCGDLPEAECNARVEEARRFALMAKNSPHRVFPDTRPEDWLDCDQCRDCFKPAMNLRPGQTAQYGLAISNLESPDPLRYRWGFIASSDDHQARPGTGYKQFARTRMTDARGLQSPWVDRLARGWIIGRQRDERRAQAVPDEVRGFRGLLDVERVASFMYPGGLVAVHANGGSRREVWDGLARREVYGTSGPRILLWFDLLNATGAPAPMGSAVVLNETPRFEVRAVGDFVQKPGCPTESRGALSPERLERLCGGECYHPSDERHPIVAIEVIRIRPQIRSGEDVASLIHDPWRRFPCEPSAAGCVVQFEDPDFLADRRDSVYYVRALQEETPAINAANLRTEFDAAGRALRTSPCHGNHRTPAADDCLAPVRERAWSSPIFVDHPVRSAGPRGSLD